MRRWLAALAVVGLVLAAHADTTTPSPAPRTPKGEKEIDRCDRDDDCVQAMQDESCCHLCFTRVITKKRIEVESARCSTKGPTHRCFEGDCAAGVVTPACVHHRCTARAR
jgi:hypothetical protein